MTVGELIEELKKHDPSRLVCVDNLRNKLGMYPAAEHVIDYVVDMEDLNGETYDVVVIAPTDWPV